MKNKLLLLFKFIFLNLIVVCFIQCKEERYNNIQPLEHSWDFAIPNQELPEGITSLSAKRHIVLHLMK